MPACINETFFSYYRGRPVCTLIEIMFDCPGLSSDRYWSGCDPRIGKPWRNSNSHGARPVHHIISIIKWIWTSRLSRKNSLSVGKCLTGACQESGSASFLLCLPRMIQRKRGRTFTRCPCAYLARVRHQERRCWRRSTRAHGFYCLVDCEILIKRELSSAQLTWGHFVVRIWSRDAL